MKGTLIHILNIQIWLQEYFGAEKKLLEIKGPQKTTAEQEHLAQNAARDRRQQAGKSLISQYI